MEQRGRRIFTIDEDINTLRLVLKKIKNTKENILITNCICRLKIGDIKFHTIFDTALYNDENNMLIVLKENSIIDQNDFKELLDKNNSRYNEITFRDYIRFKKPETNKSLFFATNVSTFAKAIESSKKKGIDSCIYYPVVKGRFTIKYFYDKAQQEQLDDFLIRGLVELDDKYVLIVNDKNGYNLKYSKILNTLEKKKMDVEIDYSDTIKEQTSEKRWVKKHEERR